MSADATESESSPDDEAPESGGEEVEVTDTADDDIEFNPDVTIDDPSDRHLHMIVNSYSAFMYGAPASIVPPQTIEFSLPRDFLPLSMEAVYFPPSHPL
jgi:hypothetical protein